MIYDMYVSTNDRRVKRASKAYVRTLVRGTNLLYKLIEKL